MMQPKLDRDLLDWYRQFVVTTDLRFIEWSISCFKSITRHEIDHYEKTFGFALPEPYRQFLTQIGEGRLAKDRLGSETFHYANTFMGPERIAEIISKRSGEWLVYPEFIASDEVPFFDIGDNSVLVFKQRDRDVGAVYYPFSGVEIAPTFEAFIRKLSEDITFYIDEIASNWV
jgi:SMI1 / KNR4 family (SUKH-1)